MIDKIRESFGKCFDRGYEVGYNQAEAEYKAKVKELENAIAKCEKAEEDFKKRTCKFRSPNNCDFCAFHSDCDEHWREGEAE